MTIHVILTGGTIDSFYDGAKDTVVAHKNSIIPEFINSLKLSEKAVFSEICMKDSRDLTKNDWRKILQVIEKSKHKKILIAHGTYTMPATARFLKKHLKRRDQVIVFTASLSPLQGILLTRHSI